MDDKSLFNIYYNQVLNKLIKESTDFDNPYVSDMRKVAKDDRNAMRDVGRDLRYRDDSQINDLPTVKTAPHFYRSLKKNLARNRQLHQRVRDMTENDPSRVAHLMNFSYNALEDAIQDLIAFGQLEASQIYDFEDDVIDDSEKKEIFDCVAKYFSDDI
jgi:hypothetical protein